MGLALGLSAIGIHTGQEWLLLTQLHLLRDLLHHPEDLRAFQDIVSAFLNSYIYPKQSMEITPRFPS